LLKEKNDFIWKNYLKNPSKKKILCKKLESNAYITREIRKAKKIKKRISQCIQSFEKFYIFSSSFLGKLKICKQDFRDYIFLETIFEKHDNVIRRIKKLYGRAFCMKYFDCINLLRFQENFVQFIIFQHYRFVFYYFFS
jgi:hypothetical protein